MKTSSTSLCLNYIINKYPIFKNKLLYFIKSLDSVEKTDIKSSKGTIKLFFIILFFTTLVEKYGTKIVLESINIIFNSNKKVFNKTSFEGNKLSEFILLTRGNHSYDKINEVINLSYELIEEQIKRIN